MKRLKSFVANGFLERFLFLLIVLFLSLPATPALASTYSYLFKSQGFTADLPQNYTFLMDGDMENSNAISSYDLTEQQASDMLQFMDACMIAASNDSDSYAEIIITFKPNDFTTKYPEMGELSQDAVDGWARGMCNSFGCDTYYTYTDQKGFPWIAFYYEISTDSGTRYLFKCKTITHGNELTVYKMNYVDPIQDTDQQEVLTLIESIQFEDTKGTTAVVAQSGAAKSSTSPFVTGALSALALMAVAAAARWVLRTFKGESLPDASSNTVYDENVEEESPEEDQRDSADPPIISEASLVKPLNDTRCPSCGAPLIEGATFCNKCGRVVEGENHEVL